MSAVHGELHESRPVDRLAILAALTLSACSKNTAPSAPAASSATDTAATQRWQRSPRTAQRSSPPSRMAYISSTDVRQRRSGYGAHTRLGYGCQLLERADRPLKAKYTVVAVDLAGHGASTNSRTDWSMGSTAKTWRASCDRIPNQQVILVGHSMGGTVALEALRGLGDRVIGIIVVDALKSVGLPPMPPADIEKRVAPFRTDFIGSVRKYVTE